MEQIRFTRNHLQIARSCREQQSALVIEECPNLGWHAKLVRISWSSPRTGVLDVMTSPTGAGACSACSWESCMRQLLLPWAPSIALQVCAVAGLGLDTPSPARYGRGPERGGQEGSITSSAVGPGPRRGQRAARAAWQRWRHPPWSVPPRGPAASEEAAGIEGGGHPPARTAPGAHLQQKCHNVVI